MDFIWRQALSRFSDRQRNPMVVVSRRRKLANWTDFFERTYERHQHPGPVLLHLNRRYIDIQSPHLQHLRDEVLVNLGIHIIDVGFKDRDVFHITIFYGLRGPADHNPQQVGYRGIRRPRPVTDGLYSHRRQRTEIC